MKNIIIEGYIYASYQDWIKDFDFIFTAVTGNEICQGFVKENYIPIAPYSIEIEMPDDIDLHKCQLIGLQNKRKLILAQNQGKLNEIDAKIQEFMAIEGK